MLMRTSNEMANTSNLRVAVIGGGPGGYAAAFLAADLGMKVTLIDPEVNPGGVCLYRGCIPSKALLHVAKLLEEAEQAKNWGIEFGEPKVDLNKLRGWKEGVVKKLTGGLGQLSKQRAVQFVQGKASFVNSTTLKVTKTAAGGEENLTFDRIIIATGSRPTVVPSLKLDSPRLMDSTGALDLPDIPGTLLVIGGGYIGLELGSVYATLGTKVTCVEMMPGLLPGADRDLVLPLHKRLEKLFSAILLNTTVKVAQGRKDWHSRNPRRSKRKRKRAGIRSRADVRWTPSEFRDPRPRQDKSQSQARRDSSKSTSSGKLPIPRSTPLATWPANRCWPTRQCMRAALP